MTLSAWVIVIGTGLGAALAGMWGAAVGFFLSAALVFILGAD